jgi:hypothetical protein
MFKFAIDYCTMAAVLTMDLVFGDRSIGGAGSPPELKPIPIASADDYSVTRWGSKRRPAQFHRNSS